jgi:NAD+ synthase (glutamine-hydrolysing)
VRRTPRFYASAGPGPAAACELPMTRLPRIALAQMEVCPGRPDLNLERMLSLMDRARSEGVELVAFPEMCLPGYLIGDLWEQDALVEDFAGYSDLVCAASADLTVLFGNVAVDRSAIGEDGRARKFNVVHVCHDGAYVRREALPPGLPAGAQPKTLHPNYRFFDDDRHFYSLRKLAQARGRSLESYLVPYEVPRADGGRFRFGVQLCEDIWFQDYHYDEGVLDTLRLYRERGAQAVFNLSSSPWTVQKNEKRNRVVREALRRSPLPFFYVNHVGAQNNGKNIVVFDGDTTAYDAQGRIVARATPWEEDLVRVDARSVAAHSADPQEVLRRGLVAGIRHLDYVRGGENRYLVGVSGGVDSATVLALLCQAVGASRVFAVNMPTRFNSALTRDNARRLCEALGVALLECPIQALYERLAQTLREAAIPGACGEYSRLVDENVQARIRGADVLAGLAAKFGLVFTNNGNKTETALGYATLYGDVNGAIAPIADLYKPQVFALARHLNEAVYEREVIPWNLLDGSTVPSAELSEAQDVTRGLGDPIRYGYHDALLRQLIEFRQHPLSLLRWLEEGTLLDRLGWDDRDALLGWFADTEALVDDLEWVARQLRVNYFKRIQAPPIIVLSKRAFGFDLRESQLPAYQPRAYAALRERLIAHPLAHWLPAPPDSAGGRGGAGTASGGGSL